MTRIMVRGSLVSYPYSETLRNAYLYLDGGRVQARGEEPAPPEHSYADLVVGGKNRLVVPGIVVGLVQATLYPFRHVVEDPSSAEKLGSIMDCRLAEKAALLTFSELALNGVALAGIKDPYPDCVKQAAEAVGIKVVEAGGPTLHPHAKEAPRGLFALGLDARISIDPRSTALHLSRVVGLEEAARSLFRREALGLEPYAVPGPGDIVVLRPRLPLTLRGKGIHHALLGGGLLVETLIVSGEPVVDGGELLTLEGAELEEAAREVGEALDQVEG